MFKEKLLAIVSKTLLSMAPSITSKTACLGLWGEPKVPNSLKKSH